MGMMTKWPHPSYVKTFPSARLLAWYDLHARQLPWRAFSPERAPAYHVFLSEFMLQQTVVVTVIPYFLAFLAKWPDIQSLARADEGDVLEAWAGLGYYARARNMHKTAKIITNDFQGEFPSRTADLLTLPGIGPYTAGAITAIAFGQKSVVLDGNIERILIRYGGMEEEARLIKPVLAKAYSHCLPDERLTDFPQALMDLGAQICRPKTAFCQHCPLQSECVAAGQKNPARLPFTQKKGKKPLRNGVVLIIKNEAGEVILQKRPSKGLLGGMLGFPSYGWDNTARPEWADEGAYALSWQPVSCQIRHVFTHFNAEIEIHSGRASPDMALPDGCFWQQCKPSALPSLMQKCWRAVSD